MQMVGQYPTVLTSDVVQIVAQVSSVSVFAQEGLAYSAPAPPVLPSFSRGNDSAVVELVPQVRSRSSKCMDGHMPDFSRFDLHLCADISADECVDTNVAGE